MDTHLLADKQALNLKIFHLKMEIDTHGKWSQGNGESRRTPYEHIYDHTSIGEA
jgi:hypothetical protein